MTSKVLLHKVPPVSKQRSHLPLNALQASFLSCDTAQPSRKLQPAQGASFTTGQRGHPPRKCLGQYSEGRTPLYSQRPRAPQTPYSSDHMNLRRNHSPVRCRTYAAVSPRPGVWPRWRTSSCCCCCCCCCCSSSCRRAAAGGRAAGGGWAAGAWGGDFGCSSLSRTYFPS